MVANGDTGAVEYGYKNSGPADGLERGLPRVHV